MSRYTSFTFRRIRFMEKQAWEPLQNFNALFSVKRYDWDKYSLIMFTSYSCFLQSIFQPSSFLVATTPFSTLSNIFLPCFLPLVCFWFKVIPGILFFMKTLSICSRPSSQKFRPGTCYELPFLPAEVVLWHLLSHPGMKSLQLAHETN